MTTVLTLASYYLPGWKAGGSLRSVANLIGQLGRELDFRVVTRDRDIGDRARYPDFVPGRWQPVGNAEVMYLARGRRVLALARLLRTTDHEVLYLNSLFDPVFTLVPLLLRRLGLIPAARVVVAPRGECSPDALRIKRWKKAPWQWLARVTRLYQGVVWQASSEYEAGDIRRVAGADAEIMVAPDLAPAVTAVMAQRTREPGTPLRLCFVARIARIKNLDFALRAVAAAGVPAVLDVYGPQEDAGYWHECERLAAELGISARVCYRGSLPSSEVPQVLADHDLLLLPSHSENFGHIIIESLSVGTPVLISDRTPWRRLADLGVGWDLPLGDTEAFAASIRAAARMEGDEYSVWRARVAAHAAAIGTDDAAVAANRRLFVMEAAP